MTIPPMPGVGPLVAYRWVPFDELIVFQAEGVDLAGATMTLQVRQYRDAPGDPLINLSNAAPPAQGLSVSSVTEAGVTTSTIRILITEATIEALLPYPDSNVAPGASVELVWAMHLSTGLLPKARWFEGSFTIVPGANKA